MRLWTILLTVLVVLPAGYFTVWSISDTLGELLDPCLHWGMGSSVSYDLPAYPRSDDPCGGSFRGTSETKVRAVITAMLVPGLLLMACILALIGAAISRPGLLVVAACVMFLEALPLYSVTLFAVPTGGALMLISRMVRWRMGPRFQGESGGSMGLKARLRHLFCDQNFFFSE
jgi:hypothetical protein